MKFIFNKKDNFFKGKSFTICLVSLILVISLASCTLNHAGSQIKLESKMKSQETLDFLHYMAQKEKEYNKAEVSTHLKKNKKMNEGGFKFKSTSKDLGDPRANFKYPVPDNALLESWYTISSDEFKNIQRFPPVTLPNGTVDTITVNPLNFRVNSAFNCTDGNSKPKDERLFWFRLNNASVYYSSSPSDLNILGFINITDVSDIDQNIDISGEQLFHCLNFKDELNKDWKICNEKLEVVTMWFCVIKKFLGQEKDAEADKCWGLPEDKDIIIKEEKIKKPIIMVPLPSPTCNEDWNYKKNGMDWECDCKEGMEQSPIDLPKKEKALQSPIKPVFIYKEVESTNSEDTLEGLLEKDQKLNIRNTDNMLDIWHHNFGKVTTIDGTSYQAQQITFHTPSNHKIDGKEFPLEVSIIHYGITKGDIGKQLILSFLFESSPGVYNKFLDSLDIFNLPDPIAKKKELLKSIFIPNILHEDSPDAVVTPIMQPFSFYTYEGSIPFPPCTERTINLVASNPLKVSNTVITLMKEAIKMPDMKTQNGDIVHGDETASSSRAIQDLNGRPVFHYSHENYCTPNKKKPRKDTGHYEKVVNRGTQYFFVSGPEPSGMPGAFVVSEKEAKGLGFVDA